MHITRGAFLLAFSAVAVALSLRGDVAAGPQTSSRPAAAPDRVPQRTAPGGQTATALADGRILLVGGEGAERIAAIADPVSDIATPTRGALQTARAWHTATVLPNGAVLVIGGRTGNGVVESPEVFDPGSGTFTAIPIVGAIPRSEHSATLLIDGRVLVAGGTDGGQNPLPSELWNLETHTATLMRATPIARVGHRATLGRDGRVVVTGGERLGGGAAAVAVAIDPVRDVAQPIDPPKEVEQPLVVAASLPDNAPPTYPWTRISPFVFQDRWRGNR